MEKSQGQLRLQIYSKIRRKIEEGIFFELVERAIPILRREKKMNARDSFNVDLTFIGDRRMRSLNKEIHKKDRPTDVISLSYIDNVGGDGFVGEIFICVPYAERQAKKIGQSLREELKFLFVHGLLHVFGYDHMSPDDEREMLARTYEILGRMT